MTPKILIIDDNVALTTLLAKALSKFGFIAIVENNSNHALMTAHRNQPDLILLDVMMPEKDGGRVLLELRNDMGLRQIPVILLTAIAQEAQGLANLGGIRSVILAKPVQIKELISVIEQVLAASRSYMKQREHDANRLQVEELTGGVEETVGRGSPMAARPDAPSPGSMPIPPVTAQVIAPQPAGEGHPYPSEVRVVSESPQPTQGQPHVTEPPPAEPEVSGMFCFPAPKRATARNPW